MSRATLRCEWCDRPFQRAHARGPAPKFCCNAHRQRAYERRLSAHQSDRWRAAHDRLSEWIASVLENHDQHTRDVAWTAYRRAHDEARGDPL